MVKICYFSSHRCFFPSCDTLDMNGNVVLCRYYCGGLKFTPRKIACMLYLVLMMHVCVVVVEAF